MRNFFLLILINSFFTVQGQKLETLSLENGNSLDFLIDFQNTTNSEDQNLVIALHWGWDRSKVISDDHIKEFYNQFVKQAVSIDNTIIVIPKCPSTNWNNEYARTAINELVNHLLIEYQIDESSIALIGYSAGGIGCWYYLQNESNSIFKIVVAVASRIPMNTKNLESPAITIVHGASDEYFDVREVRSFYQNLKQINSNCDLQIVPGASHMDINKYTSRVSNSLSTLKYKFQ